MNAGGTDHATVAVISRLTGIPRRTVRFLTDNHVLLPDSDTGKTGPGLHRSYARTEVYIAAVVGALSAGKMSVSILRPIAEALRRTITRQATGDPRATPDAPELAVIKAALDGIGRNHLFILIEQDMDASRVSMAFRHDVDDVAKVDVTGLFAPARSRRKALICVVDLTAAFAGLS